MAITIESVQFRVRNLYSPSLNQAFLWANVGDSVSVLVRFNTPTAPINGAEYYWGLIDNKVDPYSGNLPSDYSVDDNLFRSASTDDIQKFTGSTSGPGLLDPSDPKRWQDGQCQFTSLGGNVYTIEHQFVFDPLVFFDALNTNGTQLPDWPSILNGARSVQYIFRINLRSVLVDPTPIETTDDIDMIGAGAWAQGNVGFLNEFLNQGAQTYFLESFAFDNANNEIDGNIDTKAEGVISNSVGNFTSNTKLYLFAARVPASFDTNSRLQQNYDYTKVLIDADGSASSGTKIDAFKASVDSGDPTKINFELVVKANNYTENYIFWVAVSNDLSAVNHHNIFLRSGTKEAAIPVKDTFALLKNSGSAATSNDFRFLHWYETDKINGSFNHVHAFRGDDILALWRLQNLMPSETQITEFKIELVRQDDNTIIPGEGYSFNLATTSFPYEFERDINRADNNDKKYIRIVENTVNEDYDFEFGFQIWKLMIQDDIILRFTVIGTQFGESLTRVWESPRMELGQYGTTRNTTLEPQGLPKSPIAIEYTALDPGTGSTIATGLSAVVAGADTLIKATWEDNNLNDFMTTVDKLRAWIAVNIAGDSQASFRPFFSDYDSETTTPWKEVAGHTLGRAKVGLPDAKTATVEAILVWDKLLDIFGSDVLATSEVCIIPRMDRVQEIISNFYEATFHFRGGQMDLNRLMWVLTEAMPGGVITLDPNASESNLIYYFNGGVQAPQSTFLATISSGIPSDDLDVETTELGSTEGGDLCLNIKWGTTNSINPSTYNTGLSQKDSNDTVWFFNERTEFGAATGGGVTLAAIRGFSLGEDWTEFPFSLNSPAALNASLAIMPPGTKYAVHTWQDSDTSDATGTITYLDNPNLEFRGLLSDNTDSSYRNALHSKNAMSFDGINDSLHFPSAALNNEFSVFNPITVLIASNDTGGVTNAFSTFLSNVVLSAGGGVDVGGGLSFGTFNGFPRITFFDNGPAMVKNLTHGRIMRTKRNIMIYQVDPVDIGGGIYDITLRIWHNGYKQEAVISGINSATYSTVNGANTIGVCEYDSATTSKTLRKSTVAKIEMIKSITTDQECRMATNSGTFKSAGTFPYALDIDFSVTTPIDTGIHSVVPTVFGAPFNTPY